MYVLSALLNIHRREPPRTRIHLIEKCIPNNSMIYTDTFS